ncbi:MAG: trypsin-like peptidase domain-containing protein [Candidatus Marinimicrobia bacterium]|nr:trypsin-like peptidase domain-containing protein [Candidatus Neomarinimicrobiota bacterium]
MKKFTTFIFAMALFLGMLTLSLRELRNWKLGSVESAETVASEPLVQDANLSSTENPLPIPLEWSRETAITRGIADVAPAVVGITVTQIRYSQSPLMSDPFWRMMMPQAPSWVQETVSSIGSGFIYDSQGYIITNAHVVENPQDITVTLADGTQHIASLIGIDEKTDLALIKIKHDGSYPTVHLGDSNAIIMGEWVIALGNPFGLFSESRMPIATAGIISSLHMDFGFQQSGRVYQDMIQTDASINAGNSGGPLVNSQGQVIGINTFIYSGANNSGSIGIGFALPINKAMEIINELRKTGYVDRNYSTGLSYRNNNARIARLLSLPTSTGVLVNGVKEGSPAERAGIMIGDLIIGLEGERVEKLDDILAYLIGQNMKLGDELLLHILRNNERKDISILLGETKSKSDYQN